jgi:hypothetical protein
MRGRAVLRGEPIVGVVDCRPYPASHGNGDVTDATYRVIRQKDDSVAVEITRLGALPQMAAGFATEAEAADWIAQDKRLAKTADSFQVPAGRRRHVW